MYGMQLPPSSMPLPPCIAKYSSLLLSSAGSGRDLLGRCATKGWLPLPADLLSAAATPFPGARPPPPRSIPGAPRLVASEAALLGSSAEPLGVAELEDAGWMGRWDGDGSATGGHPPPAVSRSGAKRPPAAASWSAGRNGKGTQSGGWLGAKGVAG